MSDIDWKIGVEIELLAPKGASRETLAKRVAERVGGTVTRIFHPESETSALPGQPVFENLTLGFRVADARGNWVASFVDDLTLQRDLDKRHAPQPGWWPTMRACCGSPQGIAMRTRRWSGCSRRSQRSSGQNQSVTMAAWCG